MINSTIKNNFLDFGNIISIESGEKTNFSEIKLINNECTVTTFTCVITIRTVTQTTIIQAQIEENKIILGNSSGIQLKDISICYIEDIQVVRNSGKRGGGVCFINVDYIKLKDSIFKENKLQDYQDKESYGGGIFLYSGIQAILENLIIENNFSRQGGGGVSIVQYLNMQIKNCNFTNNKIIDKFNNYKYDPEYKFGNSNIIRLGGGIYYHYTFTDQYPIVNIMIEDCLFDHNKASSGGAIAFDYINNIQGGLENEFNIEFMGTNLFLDNSADVGDQIRFIGYYEQSFQKQINSMYNRNLTLVHKDQGNLSLFFGYYHNEYVNNVLQHEVQVCPQHTYNMKSNEPNLSCQKCSQYGICDGGYNVMQPISEYWMDNNVQNPEIVECIYDKSLCIVGNLCKEGYGGVMCQSCDHLNGYYLSNTGCTKCFADYAVVFNFIFVVLIISFIAFCLIYSLAFQRKRQLMEKFLRLCLIYPVNMQSYLPSIIKFFVFHCQLTYYSYLIGLPLDKEIRTISEMFGDPFQIMYRALNCFKYTQREGKDDDFELRVYAYSMILVFSILAAVLIIYSLIQVRGYPKYLVYGKQKITRWNAIIGNNVNVLFVMYVWLQPGILQQSISATLCKEVGGIKYNTASWNLRCDDDQNQVYTKTVLPVSIPLIAIFGVIIPIAVCVILYVGKKQNLLQNREFYRRFSIFYAEFTGNYQFGEILMQVYKIILILFVVIYREHTILNSVVTVMILSTQLAYFSVSQSFVNKQIYWFFNLSTLTQIITYMSLLGSIVVDEFKYMRYLKITFSSSYILSNIFVYAYFIFLCMMEFKFILRSMIERYGNKTSPFRDKIIFQMMNEKVAKRNWLNVRYGVRKGIRKYRQSNKETHISTFMKQEIRKVYKYQQNNIQDQKSDRQKCNQLSMVGNHASGEIQDKKLKSGIVESMKKIHNNLGNSYHTQYMFQWQQQIQNQSMSNISKINQEQLQRSCNDVPFTTQNHSSQEDAQKISCSQQVMPLKNGHHNSNIDRQVQSQSKLNNNEDNDNNRSFINHNINANENNLTFEENNRLQQQKKQIQIQMQYGQNQIDEQNSYCHYSTTNMLERNNQTIDFQDPDFKNKLQQNNSYLAPPSSNDNHQHQGDFHDNIMFLSQESSAESVEKKYGQYFQFTSKSPLEPDSGYQTQRQKMLKNINQKSNTDKLSTQDTKQKIERGYIQNEVEIDSQRNTYKSNSNNSNNKTGSNYNRQESQGTTAPDHYRQQTTTKASTFNNMFAN